MSSNSPIGGYLKSKSVELIAALVFGLLSSASASALQTGSISEPEPTTKRIPDQTYGEVGVTQQDLNFDGLLDLVITKMDEAEFKPTQVFFLYDPTQKGFKKNLDLSALPSPIFDPTTKTVSAHRRVFGDQSIREIFRWKNGSLELQSRTIQKIDAACTSHRYSLEQTANPTGKRLGC